MKPETHILVRMSITAVTLLVLTGSGTSEIRLDKIILPAGFTISLYASNIPDARSMVMGPGGTLFVGNRTGDKVWAVSDTNNDHRADRVVAVLEGRISPNGLAFSGKDLYVAERMRIIRYPNVEKHLNQLPLPAEVIRSDFPNDEMHGWKYCAFGPDGYLYMSIGAPCNVCQQSDARYASITRMKPDGSDFSVFAHGIRNSVGFDWHPVTKELWFTDNGRDNLGDDIPSDELNRASVAGMHFGFPFCHEGGISDPEFGPQRACNEFTQPATKLGAHVAALGMKFYTGTMFPKAYRNRIFIAEHGSWNRSKKVGYRVVMIELAGDSVRLQSVFAEGWLQNESAWGRPVDILLTPDGALLVSDDLAGAVYRIVFTPVTKVGSVFQNRSPKQQNAHISTSIMSGNTNFDMLGKSHAIGNQSTLMILIDPADNKGSRLITQSIVIGK